MMKQGFDLASSFANWRLWISRGAIIVLSYSFTSVVVLGILGLMDIVLVARKHYRWIGSRFLTGVDGYTGQQELSRA